MKGSLLAYMGLSIGCIPLTGSRSSLLGLLVWTTWVILRSRHRWLGIAAAAIAAPLIFIALPESLQTRFETIVNPEAGPENARVSGEGRLIGLETGLELIQTYPATGIGPGSWRPATGSKLESHNLVGQLCGEMGLAGVLTFGAILVCFAMNLYAMRKLAKRDPAHGDGFEFRLASAVAMAVFLLLFMSNSGTTCFDTTGSGSGLPDFGETCRGTADEARSRYDGRCVPGRVVVARDENRVGSSKRSINDGTDRTDEMQIQLGASVFLVSRDHPQEQHRGRSCCRNHSPRWPQGH